MMTYWSPREGPSTISRSLKAGVEVFGAFTYTMERLPVHNTADFGITISLLYPFKGAVICAVAYISGFRFRSLLSASTLIFAVLELASIIGFIKVICPLYTFPVTLLKEYLSLSSTSKNGCSVS